MVSCPQGISAGSRSVPVISVVLLALALTSCTGGGKVDATTGTPGSSGLRDPYFPKLGNGGYDVTRCALTLDYDPDGNRLRAKATVTARATKDLGRAFGFGLLRSSTGRRRIWRHPWHQAVCGGDGLSISST
jgi:hypothetical protein